MAQSAGNQKISILNRLFKGSSETIRENTYNLFRKSYLFVYKNNIDVDNEWLDWFIGFIEGDGAILCGKNKISLVITQKEVSVLIKIKDKLNIGQVRYNYKDKTSSLEYLKNKKLSHGKYIIENIKDIILIYILLNGNLKLSNRKLQLKKWYLYLQKYDMKGTNINQLVRFNILKEFNLNKIPDFLDNDNKISFNDGWLSGFTDAKGNFSIRIYSKEITYDYVKIILILDQKDAWDKLNEISELFCDKKLSKLRKTKNGNMFRIEILCNDINKDVYKRVVNYFDRYSLKTTKKKSYFIWKEILFIVLGNQPLSLEKISYIRSLRTTMNKYIIKNKSIGHSNKS